jgi:hypothetical protein
MVGVSDCLARSRQAEMTSDLGERNDERAKCVQSCANFAVDLGSRDANGNRQCANRVDQRNGNGPLGRCSSKRNSNGRE